MKQGLKQGPDIAKEGRGRSCLDTEECLALCVVCTCAFLPLTGPYACKQHDSADAI